jgi:DNA-binding beta-propeller fold protein YncE
MSRLSSIQVLLVVFSIMALTAVPSLKTSGSGGLKQVADVPLPGAAVRFDYQSLDLAHQRLYIAHMDANQLVVFDTKTRTVAANLDGFPKVHGVWAVPELDRVYASTTGGHNVTVVDMTSLRIVAKAGPVKYPDGLAYAPGPNRVFVSDEHGDADAVIDAGTNSLVATIPLGGGAGNTVYDPGSKRIFVAIHGRNELAVIDPATAQIINRYPVHRIEHPHGIALDVSDRLAFVAREGNNRVAVMDLESMQVLMTAPVGNDPDVLAFDPGLKLLYVAAESGHVTILRENGRALVTDATLFMPHAHTVCVDPETHLVYFPLQDVDGHPVLRIMAQSELR